jgi:hypothetical protein
MYTKMKLETKSRIDGWNVVHRNWYQHSDGY